jgi:hypothetical protein
MSGDSIFEQELTPAPLAFLGEQLSPSPFHFRFTGEDFLELASYNSQSGVVIAVQGRMLDPVEGIKPFAHYHIPNTDRSRRLEVFGLANGYLLNAVVFASSGTPRVNQTFISLHVIRGQGAARVLLATLLQGYITAEQELGFPGSPLHNSIEGGGCIRIITGTDPAAGASSVETVPTNARWQLLSYAIVFTAVAGGANRHGVLQLTNGSRPYFQVAQDFAQGPSTTVTYTWAQGGLQPTTGNIESFLSALPNEAILLAGHQIVAYATPLTAGDDLSAPIFIVREWLEGQ